MQEYAAKIAKSSGVIPEFSVSNARSWGVNAGKVSVELTYHLSVEDAQSLKFPEFEFDNNDYSVIQMRDENKELGNAVRLLQMTDEEYVNTSTYKHVAKYL